MFVFVDLMMLCDSANVAWNLISAVFYSPCETFMYSFSPVASELSPFAQKAILRITLTTGNENILT